MTKNTDAREIVVDALVEILEKEGYSHKVLSQALSKYQYLEKQERSFITRVTEGTIEYLIQIDSVLDSCSKTKVKKMKPVIRTILRMSVYQILYMDRVPDSAVCNEAVKLAAKRGFVGLKGFVNGVLRTIVREKERFQWDDDSLKYSMPSWLLDLWEKAYGRKTAITIAEAFLNPSRLTVRCNLDRASKEDILKSLKSQGAAVSESQISSAILYLDRMDYLECLEAFQKGWIQVQDLSSSLVGEAADPNPGSYVIDVCGAPGGKSLHIADKLKNTGMVEVRDLTWQKVSLIQENIARTGYKNIFAKAWDALVLDEDSIEKADLVLADLPCSGLGIIGRKPEIKYRMTADKLKELAALQREILSVVQSYVKPGGKLIFSTCTINPMENEENRNWFLKNYPFEPVSLEEKLGTAFKEPSLKDGYIQLLPGIHPCDGFFIAAFKKGIKDE